MLTQSIVTEFEMAKIPNVGVQLPFIIRWDTSTYIPSLDSIIGD
jgi:hypothetical protein